MKGETTGNFFINLFCFTCLIFFAWNFIHYAYHSFLSVKFLRNLLIYILLIYPDTNLEHQHSKLINDFSVELFSKVDYAMHNE